MNRAGRTLGLPLAAAALAAFLVALPTADALAQEEETPFRGSIPVDLASKATISADDARSAAEARYPGATVREVELEVEDGFLFYVVEMGEGEGDAEEREVLVDAGNSSMVLAEEEEEEEDEAEEEEEEEGAEADDVRGTIPMDLASMARVNQDAARSAVLAKMPGAEIHEIELVVEDGYLVYEAEVEVDGEEYEVIVDAGDGRVLERESGSEEEEEEEKD
jgi:uncharacterized membrane protein YkoI